MDGLVSHLDQSSISGVSDTDSVESAAQSTLPPAVTPDGTPMPTAPVTVPLMFGLTRNQWIILLAAAGVTFLVMNKQK